MSGLIYNFSFSHQQKCPLVLIIIFPSASSTSLIRSPNGRGTVNESFRSMKMQSYGSLLNTDTGISSLLSIFNSSQRVLFTLYTCLLESHLLKRSLSASLKSPSVLILSAHTCAGTLLAGIFMSVSSRTVYAMRPHYPSREPSSHVRSRESTVRAMPLGSPRG